MAPTAADVAYGPHAHHRYDVYLPAGTPPVDGWAWVLWVHGGGWRQGDKTDVPGLHAAIVAAGMACVSVNYRLSGDGAWPVHGADVLAALRHVRAHAGTTGLSLDAVGLWGSSAGGHLAALVGAAGTGQAPQITALRHDMTDHITEREDVRAVCAWFAPSVPWQMKADFTAQVAEGGPACGRGDPCALTAQESHLLGGSASPISQCSAPAALRNWTASTFWVQEATQPVPPYRLEHGVRASGVGGDPAVAVGQSRRLRDRLLARGVAVDYHEHPGLPHGGPLWQQGRHTAAAAWLAAQLMAGTNGYQ